MNKIKEAAAKKDEEIHDSMVEDGTPKLAIAEDPDIEFNKDNLTAEDINKSSSFKGDVNNTRSTIESSASVLKNSLSSSTGLAKTGDEDELLDNEKYKVNDATDEEIALCKEICLRERGHCTQWRKQLINGSLIIFLIMLNLFMGSSKSKSLIGCKVCSPLYWTLLGSFVIVCLVAIYIGSKMAVDE